jgi:hypothetical protein
LSDDQKAMLRLLAQREEGYEDMAALMGISVEEVREKVKEALSEVDEDEAAAQEPASPEPATPTVPPAPPAPSEPVAEESPAPTPDPQSAPAPEPADPTPAVQKRSGGRPPKLPSLKLPKDRGPAVGLAAGALVVVVLVIILIVGGSGGGGSDSATTAAQGGETTPTAAEEKNLTQAVLSPVAGGDASGRALFGRYQKKVLLQVEADGLEPSPQGSTYTVWLYRSPKLALQIGAVPVGSDRKIATQFQIPAQLLSYVASGAFNQIDISLTPTAEYKAAFNKAKSERRLPPHVGESVLRGEITGPAIR